MLDFICIIGDLLIFPSSKWELLHVVSSFWTLGICLLGYQRRTQSKIHWPCQFSAHLYKNERVLFSSVHSHWAALPNIKSCLCPNDVWSVYTILTHYHTSYYIPQNYFKSIWIFKIEWNRFFRRLPKHSANHLFLYSQKICPWIKLNQQQGVIYLNVIVSDSYKIILLMSLSDLEKGYKKKITWNA